MTITPNDVKIAVEEKLPATCDELRRRLGLWLEIAKEEVAVRHIVKADGSMDDDLFALLQLVYVYMELAGYYAKSTSNTILAGARKHILRTLVAALKQEGK